MKKHPKPTDIKLHQKSRILEISFDDGTTYNLPAEYLRVYSPSAEVRGHAPGEEVLQVGKEEVNIKGIQPVGTYAIQLQFDDDHDSGIYSWEWLKKLGQEQEQLWADYLKRLEEAGHKRNPKPVIN